MKKFLIAAVLAFSATGLCIAERNVNLEVDSVYSAQEQLQNSYLNTRYGWTNMLELDAHLIIAPAMSFGSDNLQPDALLDVFITRETGTNAFITALREAYVDMLFYGSLSLKGGFVRLDYGALNSWYNPLNIVELLNLETLYQQILIGNNRQGYEGLPTVQVNYSVPEFISELKLSFEQDMIDTSQTNFQDNYFISKFEGVYGNLDVAALMGYSGNSFSGNTNDFMPVYGGSLSFRFPYDIMFFGELIYKTQSYRPIVTNGVLVTTRTGNFFDATAKLSYSIQEPWLNNSISTSVEYFHYGEGLTPGQLNDGYNYMAGSFNINTFGEFFRMDRDLQDYIYFTLSYNFIVPKVSLSYLLDAELGSGYLQHTLTLAKSYNDVTLSASLVYNQVSDGIYTPVFFDQDFAVFLEVMMSF